MNARHPVEPRFEPMTTRALTALAILFLVSNGVRWASATETGARGATLTFDEVHSALLIRCTRCHGARIREADLDLRTLDPMLRSGRFVQIYINTQIWDMHSEIENECARQVRRRKSRSRRSSRISSVAGFSTARSSGVAESLAGCRFRNFRGNAF